MATTKTATTGAKTPARKAAGKSTQKAAVQPAGRVRQQRTKDGHRQCAARPNGPYGINAPKQCLNPTRRETAALCATHEPMWREESRRRQAAKGGASKAKSSGTSRTAKAAKAAVESTDDLEAQLEASVAAAQGSGAFASPELAEKAARKRAAVAN